MIASQRRMSGLRGWASIRRAGRLRRASGRNLEATDPLVLSDEVIVFPIVELDPAVRAAIDAGAGEYGVTKRNSRRTTRLIDQAAAELLEEFRSPTSVPDAIDRFSQRAGIAPRQVLDGSFEFLSRMVRDGFLVSATDAPVSRVGPVDTVGDGGCSSRCGCSRIRRSTSCSHRLRSAGCSNAWLPMPIAGIRRALINEARILRKLDGQGAPELFEDGSERDSPYIVVAWRKGLPSPLAAAQLRRPWVPNSREQLAATCVRVLDAYAELHGRGVLHGDVHPTNILVDIDADGVSLIDFGLAVDEERPSHARLAPRRSRGVLSARGGPRSPG